ncbi:MmgE/PrpD family protein [Marinobacter xestospongiae]|uniref:MmgE/PrpD family protein n=1 Tax=Marinobacter xestospongiae TaxID=994319 RepID=UPI00200537AC|nr:MmgE/PrpD family protein [Marinobacter xestospongiae]MCK7568582.1 MmgE/PrpD family protein [Marinobacter xestospongiae]
MSQSVFSKQFCTWATTPELALCEEAQSVARFSLVDTLACMFLGRDMHQPKAVAAALDEDGDGGAVVSVGGGRAHSLSAAALLNGARVHALDFDDYELSGSSHASGPLFSALFSLAVARNLTLREVCDAWLVGHEAVVQMGQALGYGHYDKGWHSTLTLGPVGVAAGVSRALNLTSQQMANAMALASSSSAGTLRQTGSHAKAIHEGLAAQAGLRAALMAKAGATANTDLWDIPSGFIHLYGTNSSPGFDQAMARAQLGQGVRLFPVIRKLWPSCAYTQRPIQSGENLSRQLVPGDAIVRIQYRIPRPFYQVARFGLPENDAEARFSVPYCVAAGLLRGHVTPADFEEQAFRDDRLRTLAAMVELDLYELPEGHSGDIGPSSPETLVVTLASGTQLTAQGLAVPGGAERPMTEDQLLQKVCDCGLPAEQARALLQDQESTVLAATDLFKTAQQTTVSGLAPVEEIS